MKKNKNKKSGGFIGLIIVILLALLVMKYYGLTVSGVIDWVTALFRSVLR